MRTICLVAVLVAACGPAVVVPDAGVPMNDADQPLDAGGTLDAGTPPDAGETDAGLFDAGVPDAGPATATVHACPTTGTGAIIAASPCAVFTPVEAGASASGDNADKVSYALEPVGTPQNSLVVQLNGSHGTPAGQIADPSLNVYNAFSGAGFHVIGLSYRSGQIIGVLCSNQPDCFAPTRETIVTGRLVAGADPAVADMREDEGIVQRLEAALKLMAAAHPNGGWSQFLINPTSADASQRIAWSKIITSGHSQGGGHAAYLGKLFALRRVVQLSSTCDASGSTPAPWTDATSSWATSPATSFVGFAAPTTFSSSGAATSGDTLCPHHLAIWQNMGMSAAHQHDDAAVCNAQGNTHGASLGCVDNYPRWAGLLTQ